MNRRVTKSSTRGINSSEKAYHSWVKDQPCGFCGSNSGVILDHAKGSAFIHNKIMLGHKLVNGKCLTCDSYTTLGSHNRLIEKTGKNDGDVTLKQMARYEAETGNIAASDEEKEAIADVYSVNEDVTDWMAVL